MVKLTIGVGASIPHRRSPSTPTPENTDDV
jgi:hypothetical protein